MGDTTPVWEERHTQIAEKLAADVESGSGPSIVYPSYEAFMKDLHEST